MKLCFISLKRQALNSLLYSFLNILIKHSKAPMKDYFNFVINLNFFLNYILIIRINLCYF